MHQYSIDREIRETIINITVILSVALSIVLKNSCANAITVVNSIIASSTMLSELATTFKTAEIDLNIIGTPVIYWILSKVFDRWVWKNKLVKSILKVPDLNGIWEGTLCSSYNDQSIPMELTIHQTWKKIECISRFDNSMSVSNVAAIYSEVSGGPVLYFGFHNQSKDVSTGTQSYDGYNTLYIDVENSKLSGKYFNNRPNPSKVIKGGNLGTIELAQNKDRKRSRS